MIWNRNLILAVGFLALFSFEAPGQDIATRPPSHELAQLRAELEAASQPVKNLRTTTLEPIRGRELHYRCIIKLGAPTEARETIVERINVQFVDANLYKIDIEVESRSWEESGDSNDKTHIYYSGKGPIVSDRISNGRRQVHLIGSYRESLFKFLPLSIGIFGPEDLIGSHRGDEQDVYIIPRKNMHCRIQLNNEEVSVVVSNSFGKTIFDWNGTPNFLEPGSFQLRKFSTVTGKIKREEQWELLGHRDLTEEEMKRPNFEFHFEPGLSVTDWTQGAPKTFKSDELLEEIE